MGDHGFDFETLPFTAHRDALDITADFEIIFSPLLKLVFGFIFNCTLIMYL
jgi:hypothetical protein